MSIRVSPNAHVLELTVPGGGLSANWPVSTILHLGIPFLVGMSEALQEGTSRAAVEARVDFELPSPLALTADIVQSGSVRTHPQDLGTLPEVLLEGPRFLN